MVQKNSGTNFVRGIVTDLSKVLNQKFTSRQNEGNRELSSISKSLAGMFVQPTAANIRQYETAKQYYESQGATEEAASVLSLFAANLSIISGRPVGSIIREVENAGIRLNENTYQTLNNIRDPLSPVNSKNISLEYKWLTSIRSMN